MERAGGLNEPSLSVLAMDASALELRYLSELQRQERGDALSQEHQQLLESVEEELVACRRCISLLESQPNAKVE